MVKKVFVCLMLALALGCDDDGSRDCVGILELEESECLAEDLLWVCPKDGRLVCEPTFSDGSIFVPIPARPERKECTVLDCETIECTEFVFTDLTFILPSGLEGFIIRLSDGEEAQLEDCGQLVP